MKANIDHVPIGPGGVFVIETKNYKGEVTVKGNDLFVAGHTGFSGERDEC